MKQGGEQENKEEERKGEPVKHRTGKGRERGKGIGKGIGKGKGKSP